MSAITADTRRRNHTKTMHPALGRCLKTPQSAVKSCQDHKQRYSSVNNPKQPTRQSANSITNNQPLITRTINKIKKKTGTALDMSHKKISKDFTHRRLFVGLGKCTVAATDVKRGLNKPASDEQTAEAARGWLASGTHTYVYFLYDESLIQLP